MCNVEDNVTNYNLYYISVKIIIIFNAKYKPSNTNCIFDVKLA